MKSAQLAEDINIKSCKSNIYIEYLNRHFSLHPLMHLVSET